MERLTPLAAAFLEAEDVDPRASLAIGSLVLFEGPPPAFDDVVATFRGRLPLVPRYRQVVRTDPLRLGAPYWADAPDFDLRRHVRYADLPATPTREHVEDFVSRVMTRRMERRHPLWECWFVEGLDDGRWGLMSKIHHCLADGVSGSEIYKLILDLSPTPEPHEPDDWTPRHEVGPVTDSARAARDSLTATAPLWSTLGGVVTQPRKLARRTLRSVQGLATLAEAVRPVAASSLTGPLDGRRRYAWADVPLQDLKDVRRHFGTTVNDVALAAVSGGFRRLLLHRGEEPTAQAVRSLVPVSTRAPGTESVTDNQVSLMLPYLPVEIEDPGARLEEVHERVGRRRARHEPEGGTALTSAAQVTPYGPLSWWIRAGFALPQRQITTVTTNIPGPDFPLYALGRRGLQILPYVCIADRVRIGIAMFSYLGTMSFGVTGDAPTTPDLHVLTEGIEESVRELVALLPG